jgi:hypothetical protein
VAGGRGAARLGSVGAIGSGGSSYTPRIKKFSKFMRVDITNHEEEAMCLFMEIEARWRAKGGPSEVPKKTAGSVKKGMRELKNLTTSINYDSCKGGERRSGMADRALIVLQ